MQEDFLFERSYEEYDILDLVDEKKQWPAEKVRDLLDRKLLKDSQLTISELYAKTIKEHNAGSYSQIRPVLCVYDNTSLALCIFNLSPHIHRVRMGNFKMDTYSETRSLSVMSANGIVKASPINHYGLNLSGDIRRFRPYSKRLFFNKNLVLPTDEIRDGTLALNVKMNVDNYNFVETCPILIRPGTRKELEIELKN